MRPSLVLLATAGLAMTGLANAQKVYKCTVNGIVTFSQQECGKDAQEIMDIPKGASAPTEQHDNAVQSAQLQDISNSVADADCRRTAQRLRDTYSEQRIADTQAQISHLQNTYYSGGTAANRQIMLNVDESKILTLQQQVESLRLLVAASEKRVDDALAACDQRKAVTGK